MSKTTGILLAIGAVGVLFAIVAISSVIGLNNELVSQERGVVAQYEQNRNNYDNMWKKFKEVAAVPAMYSDDLKKVYDSAIKSRYGADGSKAMFQWIQEKNPEFDSSMYKRIQVVIEAGRNSFEADQKMLIDKRRVYEVKIQQFPANFVAGFLGFPKIDLNKYDIITSEATDKAFTSKQADEIKLR